MANLIMARTEGFAEQSFDLTPTWIKVIYIYIFYFVKLNNMLQNNKSKLNQSNSAKV